MKNMPHEVDWSYCSSGKKKFVAGMYRFSACPGRMEIRVRLNSFLAYVPLLPLAVPFAAMVLTKSDTLPLLPLLIFLIFGAFMCLGLWVAFQQQKPLIDFKNKLYWPSRMPGAGHVRYKERLRAIGLDDIAALQLIAPPRPVLIFGGFLLNAVLKDGARIPLMFGPEKRLRHNGSVLSGCLGIALLESGRGD